MGKDIVLPWTCKTGEKLILPIGISLTVCGIVGWILFFSEGRVPNVDSYHVFLFFDMLLGTASGLGIILFDIVENDRLPNFKCKQQNDEAVN